MKTSLREEASDASTSWLHATTADAQALCALHGIDRAHLEHALHADARAFVARPGKAFRARLIEACVRLVGGAECGVPAAALEAIELLHAGSLIVDDIQDEAETRRGAPALHRMIGTPRALNTGNWLYFVALSRLDALALTNEHATDLTRAAHACLRRCHEGQALDLALRVGELRRAELPDVVRFISALKTGALMGFAARLGATVAEGQSETIEALERFGQRAGVALQMLDDLGSFVSPTRRHKAHEDLAGERPGWIWSWASEAVDEHTYRQLVRQLARESEREPLRERLAALVEPLARERIHVALQEAHGELAHCFAGRRELELIRAELTDLEHSYG